MEAQQADDHEVTFDEDDNKEVKIQPEVLGVKMIEKTQDQDITTHGDMLSS